MEKFLKVTVNGNTYDVKVEEVKNGQEKVAAPIISEKVQESVIKAEPKQEVSAEVKQEAGAVKVNAPMPGSVWKIKTNVGAKVEKHEVLLILEAMKMENEIVAPEAGIVSAIRVKEGDTVNPGQVMIEMN